MNLEEFAKLKKLHKRLSECKWTAYPSKIRIFYPDDGIRTSEMEITKEVSELISAASEVVEHEFGADISFCASYSLGIAAQRITLRHLEGIIKKAAKECESQAKAVLETLETNTQ